MRQKILSACSLVTVSVFATALAQTGTTRPAAEPSTRPATQPVDVGPAVKMPYTLERFTREGPLNGVVVRLDLSDPRVRVCVKLADDRDPDGVGKAVGRLDTVSQVAAKHAFEIALNASFFAVTESRVIQGKKVGYFVGNGGWPVGFHFSDGRLVSAPDPTKPALRAAMIVHADGRVTIQNRLEQLPADTVSAVSGNRKVLTEGRVTVDAGDEARHPRSAVGVSADGRTLVLLAIDGRRPGWSRGATMGEVGTLLKEFGASDGLNLDGGGSTSLVVRDVITGALSIVNRPSERYALSPAVDVVERPVIDVVGVDIRDE